MMHLGVVAHTGGETGILDKDVEDVKGAPEGCGRGNGEKWNIREEEEGNGNVRIGDGVREEGEGKAIAPFVRGRESDPQLGNLVYRQ